MADFVLPLNLGSATFSDLVCKNQNQNQQTEMLKKCVNSITQTRKWASAVHLFSWQISQDTVPESLLLCTISLE